VTLRRGIIGSLNLYSWINQVRNGDANARRTVTISLLSEDLANVVLTWKRLRTWPVKYAFADLNAKGTDVAIEELVLDLRAAGNGMRMGHGPSVTQNQIARAASGAAKGTPTVSPVRPGFNRLQGLH
jgi:hypothetical protein